ncbi:MAG: hypothetical protein IKD35_00245, partial [Clostridia bacterium]|nr:hypothetical protein [Clostridia bacterium]
ATASEELNYDEDGELAKADRVDGTNYYTLNSDATDRANGVNEAKLVGKYDVNATIWTYSNDVKVILGSVDTTDENLASAEREKFLWEIKKRQVKVEYSNQVDCAVEGIEAEDLDKYTGEYNHYITVIASNIALSEEWAYGWNATHSNVYGQIMDMVKIQYIYKDSTYSVDNATHRMQMLNENEFPTGEEAGDALVVAYCVASTDGLVTGENTIDSGNLAQSTLFQIEYRVYAKKAGTYEVSAVAEDENHTTSTQGKKNLQINRRSIKMQFEVEESSNGTLQETYEFDGGEVYRGVSKITLSNISPADLRTIGDNLAKMFSFTFETGDKNVASKVEPKITINATSGKVTIELYTSDVGTYATALALVEGGTMDVAGSYIFPNVPKAVVAGKLYQAADDESGATSWEADWEITPFEIAVGTVTISGKEVIYDGKAHSVAYEASGDGNFSETKTHGNETIQLKVSITFGDGMAEHVNAGTYTVEEISLGENQFSDSTVTRNGSKATSKNALDNYLIEGNVEAETDGDVQLVIHEREIRVKWNDSPAPTTSFVYSGSAQGLSAGDVVFEMNMKTAVGDADDWQPVGTGTINGSTITFSGLLTHDKPQGGEVSESVSFDIRDFTATDAGNYTAIIGNVIAGVSGKNDAGDTEAGNYSLVSTPDDLAYTIVKSIIQVSVSNHNITGKVFDGNPVIYEALPTLNITSTNGGATACNVQIKNARYNQNGAQTYVAAYNVGKGYDVYLDFMFANEADSKNYTIATDYLILAADAEITPKGIIITLNTTGGATATKIFDNSNLYATVESDGSNTVKSSGNEFKPGRGMTVEGFITSGITVEATFQEMGSGRNDFSAYVNDVYLDNNKYQKAPDGTYFKQLYIKMTGGDFGNYYIAEVKTKGGE